MSSATTYPLPPCEATPASPGDPLPLSETDRSRLQTFVHAGHASARARTRAQVALKLGEGWGLAEVCRAFDVCRNTVLNVRARFAEGGVDAVLAHKRQARYRQALTRARVAWAAAATASGALAKATKKASPWVSTS